MKLAKVLDSSIYPNLPVAWPRYFRAGILHGIDLAGATASQVSLFTPFQIGGFCSEEQEVIAFEKLGSLTLKQ